MPDDFDTSAEYLRIRVERIAQEITQKAQSRLPADQVQPFFIGDIVNAVGDAVGGVVNATQDAVNAAVNATQDVVNAAANVGEGAINAAENLVGDVTAATQQAVQVANLATNVAQGITLITDFIGFLAPEGGVQPTQVARQASAAELIQARRTAIQQQRTAVINDILAKRGELKSKIEGVSVRLRSLKPRS